MHHSYPLFLMSRSFIFRHLSVLFCAALFSACDDQPARTTSGQSPPREQAAQQSRQWQQQFESEHTLRMQAETKLTHEEEARSWWQTVALLLAVAAVVLLGLGATLGSAARHESQKS